MNELINDPTRGQYDIAYPIDIDEFIVYYDKESNNVLPFRTTNYFNTLPDSETVFKTNYINSQITNGNNTGYTRATIETEIGLYQDYHDMAKSFFNKRNWTGELDHGNHYQTENFVLTDLCLVHYHCRNLEQMKKKVVNNVKGLGYDTTNIEKLRKNTEGVGNHHVRHMIDILKGKFTINTNSKGGGKNIVYLNPLANFISGL